jgi:GTP cyclohydrolase FolE2
MPRLLPTGEPTSKLAVSVPLSVKADLEREVRGGNMSRYVSQILRTHLDELHRNRIRLGAALLAEEDEADVDNGVYAELCKATHAGR